MSSFGVTLTGPWKAVQSHLTTLPARVMQAYRKAALQEGHSLRSKIVKGIADGAPGGKKFVPLAPSTLATRKAAGRGGSKPLIVSGDLRNSITVVQEGDVVFVGILRTAKSGHGKAPANIADVHEFGRTFAVPMTEKMRRFLMAVFRKSGFASSGGIAPSGGASATSVVIVTIPARPFMGPVFEQEQPGIAKRFRERVAKELAFGG